MAALSPFLLPFVAYLESLQTLQFLRMCYRSRECQEVGYNGYIVIQSAVFLRSRCSLHSISSVRFAQCVLPDLAVCAHYLVYVPARTTRANFLNQTDG